MSRFIALLVQLAVYFAAAHEDIMSFETYVKTYDFKWSGDELNYRRDLFQKEVDRVVAHNRANKSWKEGINKFSALTASEVKVS